MSRLIVSGSAGIDVSARSQAAELPAKTSTVPNANPSESEARLRALVDNYLDFVARVLRNAGTPASEIDDDVQRTFIAAARRLPDVHVGAEKNFLLQIALNVAAHARRTVARRREVPAEQTPELVDWLSSPEQLTDQKRARQMLDRVLRQMDPDLRTVFALYEFEQLNMAEIAGVLAIPRGTVASRLRRARLDFHERVALLEQELRTKVGP